MAFASQERSNPESRFPLREETTNTIGSSSAGINIHGRSFVTAIRS